MSDCVPTIRKRTDGRDFGRDFGLLWCKTHRTFVPNTSSPHPNQRQTPKYGKFCAMTIQYDLVRLCA